MRTIHNRAYNSPSYTPDNDPNQKTHEAPNTETNIEANTETNMPNLYSPSRPTWLEIDLTAIAGNIRHFRHMVGEQCRLTAVVKGNAYGHGMAGVAQACLAGGADRFAVATLDEARQLREQGIQIPIHVLGYTPERHAAAAVEAGVIPTIYDAETAAALQQAAQAAGRRIQVHVKVNTGMNRLGMRPEAAPELLRTLQNDTPQAPHLEVEGIYTHFATADTEREFARTQFALFTRLLETLEQNGLRPPIAHAANSAATLTMPETHLDMVRCGIAIYGLHPDIEGARLPAGFRPGLSWKAEIAQVYELRPGDTVSYGREFVSDRARAVAVIPVGYADGFPRTPRHWQSVLIHGLPAPILGRVCMDQTIVDVSEAARVAPVRQGDEVVLIGRQRGPQGEAELSAETVAARLGTINYDVVSRILPRVPRVTVSGPS